jgi:hypothetical protein
MKRTVPKKLTLRSETLSLLRGGRLSHVKGAWTPPFGIAIGGNGDQADGDHPNCSIKITRDPGS